MGARTLRIIDIILKHFGAQRDLPAYIVDAAQKIAERRSVRLYIDPVYTKEIKIFPILGWTLTFT